MATKRKRRARKRPADDEPDEDDRGNDLTERERRFVAAFVSIAAGNATLAAKVAGYSDRSKAGLWSTASKVLARPRVLEAIRDTTGSDPLIATRSERQRFWTKVMRGDPMPHATSEGAVVEMTCAPRDRLKAAELLGKVQGDFVERIAIVDPSEMARATDEQLARIARGEDPTKVLGGST